MNISLFMHNIFNEEMKIEYKELAQLNKDVAKIPYFGEKDDMNKRKVKTYIDEPTGRSIKHKKGSFIITSLKIFLNIFLMLLALLLLFDLLFSSYYKDFIGSFPFSENIKKYLVYRPHFIPKIDLIPYATYKTVEVKIPHKRIKFNFQPEPVDLIVKDSDSETVYKTMKETTGIYSINILSRGKYHLTFEKTGYIDQYKTIDLTSTNTLPFLVKLKEKSSTLNFTFKPEDSMLYIDGNLKSDTSPYSFIYNPISDTSVHIVELKHDGYISYKRTIVFSGDSKTIPIKLDIKTVGITFKLIPWGKVYENGKLVGLVNKNSSLTRTIQAGKHTFTFRYPDNDMKKTYTYNIQKTKTITVNFVKIFGKLIVTSYPNNASVFIDDNLRGKTPLNIPLKKGYHHIVVFMDKYSKYDKYITVKSGKEYQINCVLIPIDEN